MALFGRDAELQRLLEAIRGRRVVYLVAPGGTGKTALLRQVAVRARKRGARIAWLDAHLLHATAGSMLDAIGRALRTPAPLRLLQAARGRTLIVVDGLELISGVEPWWVEIARTLGARVSLILASRNRPSAAWREDPALSDRFEELGLRNLERDASGRMLGHFGVPAGAHRPIVELTHGHPLALSIAASTWEKGRGVEEQDSREIIESLMASFARDVPSPQHWAALEAACVALVTTEPLLAAMLPDASEKARALFDWLAACAFFDKLDQGIRPHDLVRDVITADLHWRAPERYETLAYRSIDHTLPRIAGRPVVAATQLVPQFLFPLRRYPALGAWLGQRDPELILDSCRRADESAVLGIARRHEGPESAALVQRWLGKPGAMTLVVRRREEVLGYTQLVELSQASPRDVRADPATRAAAAFVRRHAPVRPGQATLVNRGWATGDGYQARSEVQRLLSDAGFAAIIATPRLAQVLMSNAEPETWAGEHAMLGVAAAPQASFTIDERTHSVGHIDLRATSAARWVREAFHRVAGLAPPVPPAPERSVVLLARKDFERAVREALRTLGQTAALAKNPLIRSRMFLEASDPIAALQSLLNEAITALSREPKTESWAAALRETYLLGRTREAAADVLRMSFSTYRRHLAAGEEELVERLWRREIAA